MSNFWGHFFHIFRIFFLNDFIKNPQTKNARTFLPLNISAVGSVFGASFLYWVDFKKDDFWTCFFISSGFSIRIYKDFSSISNQSAMMKNEIAQKWFPICVSTISNNLSERKALNWHDHAKVTNKTRYSMWKIRKKYLVFSWNILNIVWV